MAIIFFVQNVIIKKMKLAYKNPFQSLLPENVLSETETMKKKKTNPLFVKTAVPLKIRVCRLVTGKKENIVPAKVLSKRSLGAMKYATTILNAGAMSAFRGNVLKQDCSKRFWIFSEKCLEARKRHDYAAESSALIILQPITIVILIHSKTSL